MSIALGDLLAARHETLKEVATNHKLPKTGSVGYLRSRLIRDLILQDWDLTADGISRLSSAHLTDLLKSFGVKSSGSKSEKRQRLFLHANYDRRQLKPDDVEKLSEKSIQSLLEGLGVPTSGKTKDMERRVAGLLERHAGDWGEAKKTMRRSNVPQAVSAPRNLPSTAEMTLDHEENPREIEKETTSPDITLDPKENLMDVSEEKTDFSDLVETIDKSNKHQKVALQIPSPASPLAIEGVLDATEASLLRSRIEAFADAHPGGWAFEDEAKLRTDLVASGVPLHRPRAGEAFDRWLEDASARVRARSLLEVEQDEKTITQEVQIQIAQVEARVAEIRSIARELLVLNLDPSAMRDRARFVEKCGEIGILTDSPAVQRRLIEVLLEMDSLRGAENEAQSRGPGSWREREALRRFELRRGDLVDSIEDLFEEFGGDVREIRVAYEKRAMVEHGLELELPAVSGRVHGLFDLHVSLRETAANLDPIAERRRRAIESLRFDAHRLSAASMDVIDRIVERIEGFERLVEAIMRRYDGHFAARQQALMVRMLEERKYAVNTPEIRPRVLAAAGVLAVELGYLSRENAPRLPTGITMDEHQLAQVVSNLKDLADKFGSDREAIKDLNQHDSSIDDDAYSEARKGLHEIRERMSKADHLMQRLRGSRKEGIVLQDEGTSIED